MDTHGLVLFYIAAQPDATMRQMGEDLGLTERRIAQVIFDLADADLLTVTKEDRRNRYCINLMAGFRHPTLSHVTLGKFVDVLQGKR